MSSGNRCFTHNSFGERCWLSLAFARTSLFGPAYSVALGPINTVTLRIIVGLILRRFTFHIIFTFIFHLLTIFKSSSDRLDHLQIILVIFKPARSSLFHRPITRLTTRLIARVAISPHIQPGRKWVAIRQISRYPARRFTRRSLEDHSKITRRSFSGSSGDQSKGVHSGRRPEELETGLAGRTHTRTERTYTVVCVRFAFTFSVRVGSSKRIAVSSRPNRTFTLCGL